MSCECLPYVNKCCCTKSGITVVQPECQTLPNENIVNNPYYSLEYNASFWTYKFLTDCDRETTGIISIAIPICAEINGKNITVEEKVDGCGAYFAVKFELVKTDPSFGTAPEGYQFLKIDTNERFDIGVCVAYRISIIGDYPEKTESIRVKNASGVYTFGCDDCFSVPGCVPDGKLIVSKDCDIVIRNNQAIIFNTVNVDNVGEGALSFVDFMDTVFIPLPLTIGTVTVNPATLDVDTSISGQVTISGNLGPIAPGGRITVTYSIPIVSIAVPGEFTIENIAMATSTNTKGSDMSTCSFSVVKLTANKCCYTEKDKGYFTITVSGVGNSPDTTVDIYDRMIIPSGITVMFDSFGGCDAFYAGTSTPVPLFTPLSGPLSIDIICMGALIPLGGSFVRTISYVLLSSSVIGISTILNTLTNIIPENIENIIYKGTDNIPVSASINVELAQKCSKFCDE